jgi:type I restriction enzyme S subunit
MTRAMKPSGIEWIGDIPEGWEVKRLKYLGNLAANGVDKKIQEGESLFKAVHYMDVYKNSLNEIKNSDEYLVVSAEESKTIGCTLEKGDVLFTNSSETPDDMGHSVVVSENLINTLFGYHLMRFRPKSEFNLHIEKFLFGSYYMRKWFEFRSIGMTRYGLSYSDFADALIILPPLPEQEAIAAYLDRKSELIDSMIEKQKIVIEKLKLYKQSVITEAVTKGLDPTVTMKPSGIEWIGEIPEDWSVRKLKDIGDAIIGVTYSPSEVSEAGTLVLRSSNVQNGKLTFDDNVFINKKIQEKLITKEGDLLICSRNGSKALIGKCAYIKKENAGNSFGAFMTVYRSKFSRFVFYILNSNIFSYYLATYFTSTINQLTTGNLNNIQIPLPPLPEQLIIADYLDQKCTQIDQIIEQKQTLIEKLANYKKSLIYECVTGKREVEPNA